MQLYRTREDGSSYGSGGRRRTHEDGSGYGSGGRRRSQGYGCAGGGAEETLE